MNGRPDLLMFDQSGFYVRDDTGELVEFIGIATMPELDGEDVGVFRLVDKPNACLIATQAGWARGETFQARWVMPGPSSAAPAGEPRFEAPSPPRRRVEQRPRVTNFAAMRQRLPEMRERVARAVRRRWKR